MSSSSIVRPTASEQMRPGLQGFRRDATAAGLWFSRRAAIKQRDADARARETFRSERSSRPGTNN